MAISRVNKYFLHAEASILDVRILVWNGTGLAANWQVSVRDRASIDSTRLTNARPCTTTINHILPPSWLSSQLPARTPFCVRVYSLVLPTESLIICSDLLPSSILRWRRSNIQRSGTFIIARSIWFTQSDIS